jgi:hypothetical protein
MGGSWYGDTIPAFLSSPVDAVVGKLSFAAEGSIEKAQIAAWRRQAEILKMSLGEIASSVVGVAAGVTAGTILFEYPVPRMGGRIDTVLLFPGAVIVLEFKVGERQFSRQARDQVCDYALDLKNFHEPSHAVPVVPIVVATEAPVPVGGAVMLQESSHKDGLFLPLESSAASLPSVLAAALESLSGRRRGEGVDPHAWQHGRYLPTPTIIEAALALYQGHSVAEISRSDAGARNLYETTDTISGIISEARENGTKAICMVTGVPGAGKTLIGLNIATKHLNAESDLFSVFLSGNGPLVKVLQEALARDRVRRATERGETLRKGIARSEVKAFIQNVHHYRDAYLEDERPPADHVALFDEAQRAWNRGQTASFMKQKRNRRDFAMSEPEFLISCIDRHDDWGVVVCLVGGGQEINTGEAGITEWLEAIERRFPHWRIHVSDRLIESEYNASDALQRLERSGLATFNRSLHLDVSMRSFRAEHVSTLVREVLDMEATAARSTLGTVTPHYPIFVTRDLDRARRWLRTQARGTERYGIIASSHAERLKPHAIDVRSPVDPVHWFLSGKDDVRSSYYCEDVVTEFQIQGLELDWACVTWDADFIPDGRAWMYREFRGNRWINVLKEDRQRYLKNAYRVLLTRARQGMVIFVPPGDPEDPTRDPAWYDAIWDYLRTTGLRELPLPISAGA